MPTSHHIVQNIPSFLRRERGEQCSSRQQTRHRQTGVNRAVAQATTDAGSRSLPDSRQGRFQPQVLPSFTDRAFKGTFRNIATRGWGKLHTVATQGFRGCKTPWHRAMRLSLLLPRGKGKQPPGIQPALVWRPRKEPATGETRPWSVMHVRTYRSLVFV